ncbi:MAG TPA: hypothetical protein IAB27_05255 [Candidatus Coprosoma intestinipullorum]|uniref:Uncharacterized protein n=1 Tax=Candidatus Coprosoma intestinipullorum TaxID=2840752 RepID=A0A9D0ZR98_9FIRM|nr:hypothetical protein [Candidatus Coprosoma intestinipullorum]
MKSYIVVTDESESYIHDVLCSLLPLKDDEELIIFDNHSKDNTVPNIVGTMGGLWLDKKKRYKFYINMKKENIKEVTKKALSIARGKPFIVDKKERFNFEEVYGDDKN